jgi:GNAT superfamily N-acetyltransferase
MPAATAVTVRDADRTDPADRAFALHLVPRLRAFGPPPLRSPEQMDAAEHRAMERAFDAPPEGSHLLLAEAGGERLGVAYVETATDYFTGERHGHLSIIAVSESGEGRGAGRALMDAVDAWAAARGYRFVTLNVFAGNARAARLYERSGYAPDMIRYLREVPRASGEPAPEKWRAILRILS